MSEFGEPWRCDNKDEIRDANGKEVFVLDPYDHVDDVLPSDEEWARIVACVNACEGLPAGRLSMVAGLFKGFEPGAPERFYVIAAPESECIERAKSFLEARGYSVCKTDAV